MRWPFKDVVIVIQKGITAYSPKLGDRLIIQVFSSFDLNNSTGTLSEVFSSFILTEWYIHT